VLEVGNALGGSIKLWADFFQNATVHAMDIIPMEQIWNKLKNKDRIQLYPSTDAYNEATFKANFLDKQIRCDFMLDDGPHTLQSMLDFIRLYSQIMTDDGILIIEDVQDRGWIKTLTAATPASLRSYIKTYDLRQNKGRYDDIVFTIDKRNV